MKKIVLTAKHSRQQLVSGIVLQNNMSGEDILLVADVFKTFSKFENVELSFKDDEVEEQKSNENENSYKTELQKNFEILQNIGKNNNGIGEAVAYAFEKFPVTSVEFRAFIAKSISMFINRDVYRSDPENRLYFRGVEPVGVFNEDEAAMDVLFAIYPVDNKKFTAPKQGIVKVSFSGNNIIAIYEGKSFKYEIDPTNRQLLYK